MYSLVLPNCPDWTRWSMYERSSSGRAMLMVLVLMQSMILRLTIVVKLAAPPGPPTPRRAGCRRNVSVATAAFQAASAIGCTNILVRTLRYWLLDRRNSCRQRPLTPLSPTLHQLAPLLEKVTAPVCSLGLVAQDESERSLSDFAGESGHFGSPVAEARAESVSRQVVASHSMQH